MADAHTLALAKGMFESSEINKEGTWKIPVTTTRTRGARIRRMKDYGNRGGRAGMCSARWFGSHGRRHLGAKPC